MKFFELGEAVMDVITAKGAKETAAAGAKLLGKTLFNAGKLAIEAAPAVAEKIHEKVLEEESLTEDQRNRAEESLARAKRSRIENEIASLDDQLSDEDTPAEKKLELEKEIQRLHRELDLS